MYFALQMHYIGFVLKENLFHEIFFYFTKFYTPLFIFLSY